MFFKRVVIGVDTHPVSPKSVEMIQGKKKEDFERENSQCAVLF